MALDAAALNLLAFPQHWDAEAGRLRLRFVCLPAGGPEGALAPGLPSFADAELRFDACLIPGLAHAPRAADVTARQPLDLARPPLQKAALFQALAQEINIDPLLTPAPEAEPPRFRKAVTASYRALTGRRQLSPHLAGPDEFECALHEAHRSQPETPVTLAPSLRWGQVIALALRQPALAEALGLVGEAEITPPADFFAQGGWLFVALQAGSVGAELPGVAVSYAARLPPLGATRALYAAVLFPIDKPDLVLDDIGREAARYDHGHARLVHGAQVGDDGEAPKAPGPGGRRLTAAEAGDAIRLAWDDEQVAEWFNRQVSADNEAPMGTAGYRVDVRLADGDEPWQSLQRLRSRGELRVGTVALGTYEGEGMVEVVPVGLAPGHAAEYWMPRYFATWHGSSLVLSDADLVELHQREDLGIDAEVAALRLGRSRLFEPVGDRAVRLLYGQRYEFRVRLVDLSGGGPAPGERLPEPRVPPARDEAYTATVAFQRRKPPGPVAVLQRPSRADPRLRLARPRLGHPDILFTGPAITFDTLKAAFESDLAAGQPRGLGLPDPDAVRVQIQVEVRALDGDGLPWQALYTVQRDFSTDEIDIEVVFQDWATLAGFASAVDDGQAPPLPTARDLRLTLTALGREDAGYFADEASRHGPPVTVELHVQADAAAEGAWSSGAPELRGFFFRLPPPDGSVPRPAERLAHELELDHHDLVLASRPGRRTVFGCSAALRHTLAPERASLALASDADATQQWLLVLRFTLERDWSWRGLAPAGIAVLRRVQRIQPDGSAAPGTLQQVGSISLPRATAPNAAAGLPSGDARGQGRQQAELLFLDALDPKPDPLQFPAELDVAYELVATFEDGTVAAPVAVPVIRLPVTTPPSQVPGLVSAGIALAPFVSADDYSSTEPRRRRLWFEFAEPPADPGTAYFVRVLVVAPDPLLLADPEPPHPGLPAPPDEIPEVQPEAPLPVDPEWVRIIDVGQPRDDNGTRAMQPMGQPGADKGNVYGLVPLPEGLDEHSPELFGLYTCELRVGYADGRWCTAQGRFGPALRVAGVQHPAPPLACMAARDGQMVRLRAAYATPVHQGRHMRPAEPQTQLWGLLYARVRRSDGAAWHNLLLLRGLMRPLPLSPEQVQAEASAPPVLLGEARLPIEEVWRSLRLAGLAKNAPLTAMAVEVLGKPSFGDPLGSQLGHARLLRSSPLVPVPDAC